MNPAAAARRGRRAFALLLALAPAATVSADPGVVVRSVGGVPPDAAALLAAGGSGGSLRLQALALPLPGATRDATTVALVAELDGPPLLARHPGGVLGIELAIYAIDDDGGIGAALQEGVGIDLALHAGTVSEFGVRWLGSLELRPGRWRIRLLARVRQTGAFALRELAPTVVPPPLGALAPAPSPAARWVEARSPACASAVAAALDGIGGIPSALPVVASAAPTALWLFAPGSAPPPLAARVVDSLGRPAGEPAVAARASRGVSPGLSVHRLELAALGDGGAVRELRLVAADGRESDPLRLLVRAGDGDGSWTEIARRTVGALPEPVETLPRFARVGQPDPAVADRAAFRDGYRAAYRRYAAGDREGAIAGLARFEADAIAQDARRGMTQIEAADRELLESTLTHQPAARLPLVLLYRDLLRAHLAAGRIGLARRAEQRASALALGLAAGGASESEDERALAAAALELLASDLLEIRASRRAAELLESSTRHLAERVEIWMALATIHERDRDLQGARRALDEVLRRAPEHREARLRRALLERAAGDSRRAARALDALLTEEVADWPGVVAAQERVRMLLAEDDLAAALARLEPAARRWPGEPSLALALAYVHERARRPAAARSAAARAVAHGAAFGVAPRRRYAETPVVALAAGHAAVEASAIARLADLAAALGRE